MMALSLGLRTFCVEESDVRRACLVKLEVGLSVPLSVQLSTVWRARGRSMPQRARAPWHHSL